MKQYFTREFLLSNKKFILKAAAVISIIAAAFLVFVWGGSEPEDEPILAETKQEALESTEALLQEQRTETKGRIIVDVGGAVKSPQVVELEEDSRVGDAISAAGGLKDNADPAGINQAAFLTDGEKVYIPVKGETAPLVSGISGQQALPTGDAATAGASAKVNLNTATSEELQTLNGVGPATAEKILDYRTANGGFKKIEDLKNVNGIGDKTFEKLKEQIMV